MSLGVPKIPPDLHPVRDGWTRASSFFYVTGCDPRSGAIASTVSLAAIAGISNRYYLETIVWKDPEFQGVWMWNDRAVAAYPGPFKEMWNDRRERIKREQMERAGAAAEHLRTDCSSGSNHRG